MYFHSWFFTNLRNQRVSSEKIIFNQKRKEQIINNVEYQNRSWLPEIAVVYFGRPESVFILQVNPFEKSVGARLAGELVGEEPVAPVALQNERIHVHHLRHVFLFELRQLALKYHLTRPLGGTSHRSKTWSDKSQKPINQFSWNFYQGPLKV